MTVPGSAVIPRLRVDPPPGAIPHRYGLFTAATLLENATGHELTGVEYEAVCSSRVDLYPAPCRPGDTTSRVKTPSRTTVPVNGTPFAAYAADDCLLGRDPAEARAQLRERFRAGEQYAVERGIFLGELGNLPNLHAAEVIPTTAPVDLVDALGLLDAWLAAHGGAGLLHAPMTLAHRAAREQLVIPSGPRAASLLGSTWVFGAGYPGTPPADGGPDDGALWLYATPPIRLRRTALIEPGSWDDGGFDRAQNLGFLVTERIYVADWPCGAAAVKTNLQRPGYDPSAPAAPPAELEES